MKKSGFTMIELIFVVVILGILASVAIPKLAATRDDAKISKLSSSIETAVHEIASYGASKGSTTENLGLMSNTLSALASAGVVDNSEANKSKFKVGNIANCVSIELVSDSDNGGEVNVTVNTHDDNGDHMCRTIKEVIKDQNYNIVVLGRAISY